MDKQDVASFLDSAFQDLKLGALDQAESAFRHLSERLEGQDRAKALNGLGIVATQRGRGHALSLFRQAVELDPDYNSARQNLVQVYIGEAQRQAVEGKLKHAEAILDAATEVLINNDGNDVEDAQRLAIGSTYGFVGSKYRRVHDNFHKAIDALRKGLVLAPDDTNLRIGFDEVLIATDWPAKLSDYTNQVNTSELGTRLFIACFPKSASTFLKNVLVEVTGFQERFLVYSNGKNDTGIYLPAVINSATLDTVTQIHMRPTVSNVNIMQGFFIKPIVLVRNIFDTLLSYKEHHDVYAKKMSFYDQYDNLDEDQRLSLIVDDRAAWYIGFFAGWQRAIRDDQIDGLWVTYEELIEDSVGKVEEILRFYGLDRSPKAIADAIEKVSRSKVANRLNKGISGRGQSRFTDEHRAQITRIAGYHPDIDFSLIGL